MRFPARSRCFSLTIMMVWVLTLTPLDVARAQEPDDSASLEILNVVGERSVPVDNQTADETKTIGSRAPELDIETWMQLRDGFEKITKPERGRVYVLEFWATWCTPCVGAVPFIAETQEKFKDNGVQVILVTDEKTKAINQFLDRQVGADDLAQYDLPAQTYRKLTAGLTLATDPDESTYRDYLEAAQRTGIPCSFIIGKQGVIEWIGHPLKVRGPLEKIVVGTWDRDKFAEKYQQDQRLITLLAQVSLLLQGDEIDEALTIIDDFLGRQPSLEHRNRLTPIKLQILASSGAHHEHAVEFILELLADETHTASSANDLTWRIYMMAEDGIFEDERVSRAALKLTLDKSKDSGNLEPFILDTAAHLQHINGQHQLALQTQSRACDIVSEDEKAELIEFKQQLETLVGTTVSTEGQ